MTHARRWIRRWLCTCGRRFPCGPYLNRRDQESRRARPDGATGQTLVGWTVGHREPGRQVVTGGITIVGGEIRIDVKAVDWLHDVDRNTDPDDVNCPMCGEEYPCEVLEAVGVLEEALKPWLNKTPASTGAGKERT